MSFGEIVIIAAVVLAVVVVGLYLRRQRVSGNLGELVQMCRGDVQQAQRLVAGERARAPGISKHEAARRALRAWRRDLS